METYSHQSPPGKPPLGLRVDPLLPVADIIHTKKWFVIHRRFTGGEGGDSGDEFILLIKI